MKKQEPKEPRIDNPIRSCANCGAPVIISMRCGYCGSMRKVPREPPEPPPNRYWRR